MSMRLPPVLGLAAMVLLPLLLSVAFVMYMMPGGDRGIDPVAPRLSLPIDCEPGKTCFIQSYVDVDPGPGAQDYTCGSATYDGHKGTDFRVLSAAAAAKGVDVIASAEGVVRGVRDGVDDVFPTADNRAAIAGRECGNGVVLTHPGGWETQYCHMQKGSVAVKTGDTIARGQRLGHVGFSGMAEFAHVHLEIRKDGKPIDPFSGLRRAEAASAAQAGRVQSEACEASAAKSTGLWMPDAVAAFPYVNGQILDVGFTADTSLVATLEMDDTLPPPVPASPQLAFYARVANLRQGDKLSFKLVGPAGFVAETETEPMERPKALYRGFVGKKLTQKEWPAGSYDGTVAVVRAGSVLSEKRATLDLK